MLTRKAAPSVLEFATRRRIKVVVLESNGDQGLRREAEPRDQESAMSIKIADE
jgi:hypothetical protein